MAMIIFCVTFFVVLVVYWIMPVKKMKAVNKELKSLLQVLPISQIIKTLKKEKPTWERFKRWRKGLADADEFRQLLKWPLLHKPAQKSVGSESEGSILHSLHYKYGIGVASKYYNANYVTIPRPWEQGKYRGFLCSKKLDLPCEEFILKRYL